MIRYSSPLRYPGGKGRISPFLEHLIQSAGCRDGLYLEPYAGGAGAALTLLFREVVDQIHINDASPAIYAFWRAITEDNDVFCAKIQTVPLDMSEWHRQRAILLEGNEKDIAALGFAAFYLNRTNRSGIIRSGGVIGGLDQAGRWKLDARFNRETLVRRVKRVGLYRGRIQVTNMDAGELLRVGKFSSDTFIYLDPPYYHQAERLYDQWYSHEDHVAIAAAVDKLTCPWVVSYDDCEEIRGIYTGHPTLKLKLRYSAARSYQGAEVLFMPWALAATANSDLLPATG